MNLPITRSVGITRIILLLVLSAWCSAGAMAQDGSSASHSVTLKRTASTRVSGPGRIPIRQRPPVVDAARLEVASNVDVLKIVFALVEPETPRSFLRENGVDPSTTVVRQLYSAEQRIQPAAVREVDLKEIVSRIPRNFPAPDVVDHRRLVVTITE